MAEAIVHVIDDDDAVRGSLAFVLGAAGLVARTYASPAEFLDAVDAGLTGCVVTDVRMPEIGGLELVRRLRARGVALPVIVMTGHGDVSLAVAAMKEGVVDFLEKPFEDRVLLAAIRGALDSSVRASQEDADRARFQAMLTSLSPREAQVLRGVVDGQSNKEIARTLDISPRTVEVYRAHVMNKTSASGLSELVRIALLAGF